MDKSVFEQTATADITSEITDKDLSVVRQVLSEYLMIEVPETLELQVAIAVGDLRIMHVGFDSPEDGFGPDAKYTVRLMRQSPLETWALNEITVYGQHILPGDDSPISFRGALRPETIVELAEHVSQFLEKSGAGPMQISGVTSNTLPPLRSFPEEMGEPPARAIYSVHLTSLEPPKLYTPPPGRSAGQTVLAVSSSQGGVGIWLERDERGHLVTTDVSSSVLPERDPELLRLLRSKLERPDDPSEVDRRMAAIRSVLPDRIRNADMLDASKALQGHRELFTAHFAEAEISDRQRARLTVTCTRTPETDTGWQCHYNVMSISQFIPEQQQAVMLGRLGFDEEKVDDLVYKLRASLADHPAIDSHGGVIEISHIHRDGHSLSAHIRNETGFYKVQFRYDGNIEIESLEVIYRMDENPGS